jgi:hypothetical protein
MHNAFHTSWKILTTTRSFRLYVFQVTVAPPRDFHRLFKSHCLFGFPHLFTLKNKVPLYTRLTARNRPISCHKKRQCGVLEWAVLGTLPLIFQDSNSLKGEDARVFGNERIRMVPGFCIKILTGAQKRRFRRIYSVPEASLENSSVFLQKAAQCVSGTRTGIARSSH